MKMQIERWGNSLAVRLPRLLIERFKLKEGDEIVVDVVESALAKADADAERRRDEALKRLTARRRPLPPRFKFDRQEANSR